MLARQAADAIERTTAKAELRESEARQSFLLSLSDALRALKTPAEIASTAAERLAERFGLSRAFYAEFVGSRMRVDRDHTWGVASIAGEHDLDAFGSELLRAYHRCPVVKVDDVRTDARFSDEARLGLLARQVGAYLDVVLFEQERWVSLLALQSAMPRTWTAAEESLSREVGERVKVAIERARAEDKLCELNETLEMRVREEIAARESAQARLAHAQRMEALGQLAGGIAHDINNVLQAVGGGASLIERRPGDPASVRRLARMVGEAAERGSAVTRRLLAFSRRGDLRAEAVDPLSLLAGMCEIFTHTLGAGIGIRVDAEPGLPPLLADKSQLETVLVNLAANARDAMGGKGMIALSSTVDVRPGAPTAFGTPFLKPGRYVRLVVRDDGPGMPPEVLARVAEPFFTTKPQGEGTGLGLAMARGFAEQSGGAFHIESGVGRGTAVSLWFPVADAPIPARDDVASRRAPTDRRRRILFVDDEVLAREITAEGLEEAGFSLLTAESGTTALDLLDAGEAVDLLVTDLSMPRMDGLALIREAQRRRPGLPAVLLTGFATNAAELAVGGAVSGTFSLLRKPVPLAELADRIAVLLTGVEAGG